MTFANPLPWWALLPVVAAAGAIAWLAYSRSPLPQGRRIALSALRLLTLLLLVILLMRPVAGGSRSDPADAVVPILVDTSRSMGIEDADGRRRIDRAREIVAADLLPVLSARFETEVLAFGDAVAKLTPADLTASARRSDLSSALHDVRERYRGRAIAGVVLISDGGDTSQVEGELPEAGAPVFAIGVGAPAVGRDREVLSVTAAEAVLDESRVDLAVSAVAHGYGTAAIELRLLENGQAIEVRRATPAADGSPVREIFQVTPPKRAATVYTVEVPAIGGELVPENNSRSVLVQPPARPRRVLLVQGAPGFEHSFLRRAWSGDPGLTVDSVVRKGRDEQGSDTFYVQAAADRGALLASGYPATRKDLFAYDAVVLANMEGAVLTTEQIQATRDFVGQRGGGLLVLGAQTFLRKGFGETALEDVLPLDLRDRGRGVAQASSQPLRGANRVALTDAGESHPIMQLTPALDETRKRWEAVPALASIAPLGGPRPGATVLAVTSGPGGATRALVAVQRYGDGRSMVFTGEAAWRWRMMLPASDRSYDTFWRQAIRWLSLASRDPVNLVLPADASPGDALAIRVQARTPDFDPQADATVTLRATRPDGRVDALAAAAPSAAGRPSEFVARYRPDEPGVYRLTADVRSAAGPPASAAASLLVGGADSEMTDPRLNLHALQRVALASGGRVIEPGDVASLAGDLHAALPTAMLLLRQDLWHTGWSFAMLLTLLGAEWVLRRRWGLR